MSIGHLMIGTGNEPVLLLPDWFGGSAYLAGLGHRVDTKRYRYAIADFRGYGQSREIKGEYSIAEMTTDASDLADALGFERFHLVGHSMGGKVVQLLAATQPERLLSAIAITPTPPIALDFDPDTQALMEGCASDINSRQIALDAATGSQYGEGFVRSLAELSMSASDPSAFRAYLDAWAGTDITSSLGISDFPLHVLLGRKDPFVPESAMETLSGAFPQMRLSIFDDIGHYPLLEVPPRTTALMEGEFAERIAI